MPRIAADIENLALLSSTQRCHPRSSGSIIPRSTFVEATTRLVGAVHENGRYDALQRR